MDEYIEREFNPCDVCDYKRCSNCILHELAMKFVGHTAADVAPVVHGRWIEKPFLFGTSNFCSLCDSFYGMPHGKFNYCPHCGARMDGE